MSSTCSRSCGRGRRVLLWYGPVKNAVRRPGGGQMDESTESQLRDTLAELGNARFRQADAPKSRKLSEHRREAEREVTKVFVDAGLDVQQLEKIQSKYRSELHRVAEERRLEAVAKSPGSRDFVHKTLDAKRRLVDAGG